MQEKSNSTLLGLIDRVNRAREYKWNGNEYTIGDQVDDVEYKVDTLLEVVLTFLEMKLNENNHDAGVSGTGNAEGSSNTT